MSKKTAEEIFNDKDCDVVPTAFEQWRDFICAVIDEREVAKRTDEPAPPAVAPEEPSIQAIADKLNEVKYLSRGDWTSIRYREICSASDHSILLRKCFAITIYRYYLLLPKVDDLLGAAKEMWLSHGNPLCQYRAPIRLGQVIKDVEKAIGTKP